MRQGWDTALDVMTDLVKATQTREGRLYLDNFAESLGAAKVLDPETEQLVPGDMDRAYQIVNGTVALLPHSDPMFVSGRRASTWRQIKEVVVVTLRHAKNARYEGEEREVEWTHRWMVGAHWRNQYYPSEKTHHQIWIAPYVKGPDDKPLILKRRAFELVR